MKEYEKIDHFCYFHPEHRHILGVFPEEFPGLSQYPYELIKYKLAKPFYYGEMGFDGTYKLVKIKNKLTVIQEKPKNKIAKEISKFSIYELEFEKNKKIDQSDLIIEVKNNKAKIYPQLNIDSYPEADAKIFITKKNNPFFLVKKTVIPISKKEYTKITDNNETISDKSIFIKNINSNVSLVENYQYFSKKPFLVINILELDQLIITANPQFYSISNDLTNASISIKEKYEVKKFNIDMLLNSFHFIKDEKLLLNKQLYDKIELSITEFPITWVNEMVLDVHSVKVLYNSNNILIFGEEKFTNIYITPKNNPFKILHKTKSKSIIRNVNIDFDLSAIIICNKTNKLKMIPCERI